MAISNNQQWGRPGHAQDLDAAVEAGYQVRVSHETEDPDWDAFLAQTPGGHHVQTTLWAQVKALLGWQAARVVVTQGAQIVAGAQLLLRPLPFVGAIGYVTKGPLLALEDPLLAKLVISKLHQVAKSYRSQYLVVQPPGNGQVLADQLSRWGFKPSSNEVAPTATVVIDLTKNLDDILAQMKSETRHNIRRGQRKGVTVREGTGRDLPTFYRLYVASSQRQKFSPPPEEYFSEMWRLLDPHGYVKLFLTEYEGEAVSALWVAPFGDTVLIKRIGWSGCHGSLRPNELLYWTALQWAKSQGYRYYDLEGIDQRAARAIVHGEPCPDSLLQSPTRFKLGFGGQVTFFPGAYDYVYNPFLRWAYNMVFPKMASWPVVAQALNRLRPR
jgi:lipid II:glycine glycyltransferase (peptidoglycan interpeptide bridge formation enzyme)